MKRLTGYVRMLNRLARHGRFRLRAQDDPNSDLLFEGTCSTACIPALSESMYERVPVEIEVREDSSNSTVVSVKLLDRRAPKVVAPVTTQPSSSTTLVNPPTASVPREPEEDSVDDFLELMGSKR